MLDGACRLVDIGWVKATGRSIKIYLPKTCTKPEVEFESRMPKWSNAIEGGQASANDAERIRAARGPPLLGRYRDRVHLDAGMVIDTEEFVVRCID